MTYKELEQKYSIDPNISNEDFKILLENPEFMKDFCNYQESIDEIMDKKLEDFLKPYKGNTYYTDILLAIDFGYQLAKEEETEE